MTNVLLELFEKSVNSKEERRNLIFSDLVDKANHYSISSDTEIDENLHDSDILPEEYRNLKLTVDKDGNIKVPNLFQ